MKGVIWSYVWEDALEELKEIEKGYERIQINPVKKTITHSRNEACTVLENGDCWKVVRGIPSSRGYKVNVSYIDRRIPQKIVDEIIKPCSIAYPFKAFYYYGPHPKEDFLRGHRAELDLFYDDINMLSQERIDDIIKLLINKGD